MPESEEINSVTIKLREMADTLSTLSHTVIRIKHTNDRVLPKAEKLDAAVVQLHNASDSLQSACIELMAAEYRRT